MTEKTGYTTSHQVQTLPIDRSLISSKTDLVAGCRRRKVLKQFVSRRSALIVFRMSLALNPLKFWISFQNYSQPDAWKTGLMLRIDTDKGEVVLLLLDSNHSKEHVAAELDAYGSLVTPGSYIVSMDGIMRDVAGAPRTKPDWAWNNPVTANREFVARNPEFEIVEPEFLFNESVISKRVTYWPESFIRRIDHN